MSCRALLRLGGHHLIELFLGRQDVVRGGPQSPPSCPAIGVHLCPLSPQPSNPKTVPFEFLRVPERAEPSHPANAPRASMAESNSRTRRRINPAMSCAAPQIGDSGPPEPRPGAQRARAAARSATEGGPAPVGIRFGIRCCQCDYFRLESRPCLFAAAR